jgi:predicted transposase/invertase (TIGR01784 family)
MGKIVNPHDKFFKEVYSDKERAVDFLESFLPEEVAVRLNLDSIEIRKDSFIDEELRESFSDILYEVELAGSCGYIYILFEHKSYPDRYTALQLLKYMVRIWELHLRQSANPELPLIIPLVLYQGVGAWKCGDRLRDLLSTNDAALLAYTPDYRFLLFDLSVIPDEQIRTGVIGKVMVMALKYAMRDELPEKLFEILGLLATVIDTQKGLQCLEALFRYLVQATDKLGREDFKQALARMPEGDAIMSTLAEQWFQEGLEKGIEKGIEKGVLDGRVSEAHEVIIELLEERFGPIPPALRGRLAQIRSHELLRTLRRRLSSCRGIEDFERMAEDALSKN